MEKVVENILQKLPFISRKLDTHMREVVIVSTISFVLRLLGAVLAFCFSLLLAKYFGAEGAGVYYLALTIATIATIFGRMGLDNSLLRFTAANASVGNWAAVKGVYIKGMKLALFASITSTLLMFFSASLLSSLVFHKPDLTNPIRWMSLAVIPITILTLHAEMLRGLKRIKESILVTGVGVPAFSLIALYFFGVSWGVTGAIWAYVIATIIAAGLGILLWRFLTPQLGKMIGKFKTNELLKSSTPLFWVASLDILINGVSVFVLGVWGTKEEVGIFGAASRMATLVSMVLTAVNGIAAPKFAELYKKNDLKSLDLVVRHTTKLMIFAASPFLIVYLFFPAVIMGLFGHEFRTGASTLAVLGIGQFINVATGSVGYLLMMSGNEQLVRNRSIFIVIISVLLNLALIPRFGILGAGIATTISVAATNLISVYQVWSKLNIWTIPIFIKEPKK